MPALFLLIVLLGWVMVSDERPEVLLRRHGPKVAAAIAVLWVGRTLWRGLTERVRLAAYEARGDRLRAFASAISRGAVEGKGTYSGGTTTVTGEMDGLPVRLVVRSGTGAAIAYEVWCWNALVEVEATRATLLARAADRRLVRPTDPAASARARAELEVDRALGAVLDQVPRASLSGGLLRAEGPWSLAALEPDRLLGVFRAMVHAARLCERREVDSPAARGRAFACTVAGGDLRCPFCRESIDPAAKDIAPCSACRTLHHMECLSEARGCTVLGCAQAGPTRFDDLEVVREWRREPSPARGTERGPGSGAHRVRSDETTMAGAGPSKSGAHRVRSDEVAGPSKSGAYRVRSDEVAGESGAHRVRSGEVVGPGKSVAAVRDEGATKDDPPSKALRRTPPDGIARPTPPSGTARITVRSDHVSWLRPATPPAGNERSAEACGATPAATGSTPSGGVDRSAWQRPATRRWTGQPEPLVPASGAFVKPRPLGDPAAEKAAGSDDGPIPLPFDPGAPPPARPDDAAARAIDEENERRRSGLGYTRRFTGRR